MTLSELRVESLGVLGHVVFQVEEVALLLTVDDLLGREGGEGFRIPVHHAQTTIDEAFVIEVDEDLDDALRALHVHGEGGAVPVAAGTQTAQLLEDDASVLVGPLPCVLQELLTGEVVLLDALFGELLHHLGLRSDGGVVGAGNPEGVLTLHTGTTDKDILNGVVQHVSHVEHSGNVGRRNHDGIGLASVGLTRK